MSSRRRCRARCWVVPTHDRPLPRTSWISGLVRPARRSSITRCWSAVRSGSRRRRSEEALARMARSSGDRSLAGEVLLLVVGRVGLVSTVAIDHLVVGDREEPRGHVVDALPLEALERLQEDLAGGVFGQALIAQPPAAVPVDADHVTAVEFGEGDRIRAARRARDSSVSPPATCTGVRGDAGCGPHPSDSSCLLPTLHRGRREAAPDFYRLSRWTRNPASYPVRRTVARDCPAPSPSSSARIPIWISTWLIGDSGVSRT